MFISPFLACHLCDSFAVRFNVTCFYPYNVTNVQKLHKPSSYKVFFLLFCIIVACC